MNLTPTEIEAIHHEAAHYEHPSAAAIEALKIVQGQRGWVSDDNIRDIAELLAISPAELDGVATFYNLIYRRPVGRRVIHYCNSVSCWMLGAEDIRQAIADKLGIGLGETTADGEYTLLPIVCLGACDKAPVLMIGDRTHFNVDRTTLDKLLVSGGSAETQGRIQEPRLPAGESDPPFAKGGRAGPAEEPFATARSDRSRSKEEGFDATPLPPGRKADG